MFCQSCGRSLADTLRFCDACGTDLTLPPRGATTTAAITQQLKAEMQARSRDAWKAIKLLARSPVGGLAESFAMLNDQRAISVGIFFAIFYELALLLGVYIVGSKAAGLFGVGLRVAEISASLLFKILIIGIVPFASLIGACALARAVFRGDGRFAGDVYTAGAVLLPLGFLALATGILGLANVEVIAVVSLVAITYLILMLYAGCSRIGNISEAGAAPAVPIILLVSAWLTKIIVTALL